MHFSVLLKVLMSSDFQLYIHCLLKEKAAPQKFINIKHQIRLL